MNPNPNPTAKESPACHGVKPACHVVKTGAPCLPAPETWFAVFCLLVCLLQSGCTVCQNVKRTLCREPSEYSWRYDRKESVKVYRTWAECAWLKQCKSASPADYSKVYALGFKDGFVDMVFAGGSGEPPALPPREYWNVDLRNPQGHMEATDWFAGYRHGAQLAREEGYRERALVPASLTLFGQRDKCSNRPNCQCPSCSIESSTLFDSLSPNSPVPDSAIFDSNTFDSNTFDSAMPNSTMVPNSIIKKQPLPQLLPARQSAPLTETPLPGFGVPAQQEALPTPPRTTTQAPLSAPLRVVPPVKPDEPLPDLSPAVDAIFDSSASIQVSPSRPPARRLNFVAAARVKQANAEISLSDQRAKAIFQQ